jgi:hypothetical protein
METKDRDVYLLVKKCCVLFCYVPFSCYNDKGEQNRTQKGDETMAGKKIQITLPPEVFEKLERMSKKTSQKKSAVIISAINTIYALQQQQTTVQIDGQGVMI